MKCVFCDMINGNVDVSLRTIESTDDFFTIFVLWPENYGHFIVIPKKHFSHIGEMSSSEFGKYAQKVKAMAEKITPILGAEAYALTINNNLYLLESDNDRHVGHLHFHVMPKYKKDQNHPKFDDDQDEYFASLMKLVN